MAALVPCRTSLLNVVVLGRGAGRSLTHPELSRGWRTALSRAGDCGDVVAGALLIFPKLALGMSGFETGVSVMPLSWAARRTADTTRAPAARRGPGPQHAEAAARRGRDHERVLLLSSFVTTLLVPPEDYRRAAGDGRALAYLAHVPRAGFGTLYDLSTILILWFAGASAMAGLLNLVPRYLPRFGMAPRWAAPAPAGAGAVRDRCGRDAGLPADVEAQGGAYATGVLVLMLSAASRCAGAVARGAAALAALLPAMLCLVFAYTLVDNCVSGPTA